MTSWLESLRAWLGDVDSRGILLFLGEKVLEGLLQAIAVVVIGWLVVYRQWRQLTQGRSDQVIFSANLLTPIDGPPGADGPTGGGRYLLQLRTVLPPRTVDQLLDNVALRREMRRLAEAASLADPVLSTEGTAGFEIVNDVTNCIAGELASSPFPRQNWLIAVTCEDRKVVRKCCIRALLIRRDDIDRLASWEWCRDHILVEEWYQSGVLEQASAPVRLGTAPAAPSAATAEDRVGPRRQGTYRMNHLVVHPPDSVTPRRPELHDGRPSNVRAAVSEMLPKACQKPLGETGAVKDLAR